MFFLLNSGWCLMHLGIAFREGFVWSMLNWRHLFRCYLTKFFALPILNLSALICFVPTAGGAPISVPLPPSDTGSPGSGASSGACPTSMAPTADTSAHGSSSPQAGPSGQSYGDLGAGVPTPGSVPPTPGASPDPSNLPIPGEEQPSAAGPSAAALDETLDETLASAIAMAEATHLDAMNKSECVPHYFQKRWVSGTFWSINFVKK